MKIQLPKEVNNIIQTLTDAGFEAFAVGGCVRDSILGRIPEDWDITTSAKPQQVKALFKRTIDTGIQHGTVTIMKNGVGYEVTTYRIDGEYEDSRHPKNVEFTENLVEDLKRRDFTINAMAYSHQVGLVDEFGGIEDLKNKVIRCVGNATNRFEEDALRIMRAIRFAAQLGATIDEDTMDAIKKLSANLSNISAERIQVELNKLITSDHPELMMLAYELGVTQIIMPEFDDTMGVEQANIHHCYDVGTHTIVSLKNIPNDKVLRLTMLFHDMGKVHTKTVDEAGVNHFHGHNYVSEKIARSILTRLKYDNNTINMVTKLVRYHDERIPPNDVDVRKAIVEMGRDVLEILPFVQRADALAQSEYNREEKLNRIEEVKKVFSQILERGDCTSLAMLALKGKDVMDLGVKQGKAVGEILHILLEKVVVVPALNDREVLKNIVLEYIKNEGI